MILNRFRNIVFCLSITAILFSGPSCTKKKNISGSEYIRRDVFVEVLLDIHLIDGVTNDVKYYRKYNPGDSIDMYSYIFEKHNVTEEQYKLTVEEYSKYPELFDKVYDEVIMKLNQMQDEAENSPSTDEAEKKKSSDQIELKRPVR